jgi:hypothetical protein
VNCHTLRPLPIEPVVWSCLSLTTATPFSGEIDNERVHHFGSISFAKNAAARRRIRFSSPRILFRFFNSRVLTISAVVVPGRSPSRSRRARATIRTRLRSPEIDRRLTQRSFPPACNTHDLITQLWSRPDEQWLRVHDGRVMRPLVRSATIPGMVTDVVGGERMIASLGDDGYVVLPRAVPDEMCLAVVAAIDQVLGIRLDNASTWGRIGSELDQVPMWGHQSQWDIRQLPNLYAAWSRIWGRDDLWVDVNSCRVTPPWLEDIADALPIHFDVDPHDSSEQWFPGLVALTDAAIGGGGFCCVPSLFRDPHRWPTSWPEPGRYQPQIGTDDQIVEIPLERGDVLIWDSHLPHGTVRNIGTAARAVFYLQLHPSGTNAELVERLADIESGRAPPWVRGKPGHDRLDRHHVTLSHLGQRLLGGAPNHSLG